MNATLRLAQVEVVDADGRGTRLIDVFAWPLRIGRALDNDIVLPDPHVAAHHATVMPDMHGRLQVSVGDSRNGVRLEQGHSQLTLRAGQQAELPPLARWRLGHSQVMLRCPQDPLAAELPLAPVPGAAARWMTPLLLLVAMCWVFAMRWIDGDPDAKWLDYVAPLAVVGAGLFAWGLMWGMASKLFTGRFTLVPHVHLALVFVLFIFGADLVLVVLSFSLDWPLLSHWRGGIGALIGALWLTQHLRLVQPQRMRAIGAAVAACTLLGIAVAMGTTWYRTDRLLDELYAPHLMPPAWRLTRGAPVSDLLTELRTLEQPLRERAAQAKAEDYEP